MIDRRVMACWLYRLIDVERSAVPDDDVALASAQFARWVDLGTRASLVLLVAGAELLVRGASKLALAFGISSVADPRAGIYTAIVAGTVKGMGNEPKATFSTCFGSPFLPRHPRVYGDMLAGLIERYGADCWLVNTGWSGGKYGVGKRMSTLPLPVEELCRTTDPATLGFDSTEQLGDIDIAMT